MSHQSTRWAFVSSLVLAGLFQAHPPAWGAACPPNTCCIANPTPGTPACGAAVGNPINVMTGNKFEREVDMAPLPGVLGLELVRYYNSESALADERGILGRGWRLSYDEELLVSPGAEAITLVQGDGTRSRFTRGVLQTEPGVTVYSATVPGQGPIRSARTQGGVEYSLGIGGQIHTYGSHGKLIRISAPTGEELTLQRDADGYLLRVTDPQGRSMSLEYLPAAERRQGRYQGAQNILTPLGRFDYAYGNAPPEGSRVEAGQLSANLASVTYPAEPGRMEAGVKRLYHHESARHPFMLSGISVQGRGTDGRHMNERIATWGYDVRGRANLSVRGAYDPLKPGLEEVKLVHHPRLLEGRGETELMNSLGQITRYRWGLVRGEPQLLEVRGAGCATCGPVNIQYRYDARGRRSEVVQLDPQGRPALVEITAYDSADRVLKVSEQRYDGKGRAGVAVIKVRHEYGADPRDPKPVLVARPSVIPGQEHTLRTRYNAQGQPVELTEAGFSPIDESGKPVAKGAPITRSTRFSYVKVGGRNVLAAMDGPLPNGPLNSPADSDVTRLEWDEKGNFITAVELPGGRRSSLAYYPSGFISEGRNAAGALTRLAYDASGKLQRVSSEAPGWGRPREWRTLRDAMGRVTEGAEGAEANAGVNSFLQAFDVAGHLLWRADHLGILQEQVFDSEGRVVKASRVSNRMVQGLVFEHDAEGRLARMRDGSGATYEMRYGADGKLAGARDGFGDVRMPGGQAVRAQRSLDDFGRLVETRHADSGRRVWLYDAADRLVGGVDALGNRARYAYDLRGRILEQGIRQAGDRQETLTRWHYEGDRLVRLEHPGQDEFYAYDSRGLRVRKSSVRKQPTDQRKATTWYAYDNRGTLVSTSMADGAWLQFERNGQGQVVALRRQPIHTRWLQWSVPPQDIVTGLRRDIVGLQGYLTGNGIRAEMARSRAGVLGRMVYTRVAPVRAELLRASLAGPGLLRSISPALIKRLDPAPPGALGLSADPNALLDRRYLWDTRGNLLHEQSGGGEDASARGFAYDFSGQLLATASSAGVSRYAYDALGRRVLAQEGVTDPASFLGSVKTSYPGDGSYRWSASDDGRERVQVDYDTAGQPLKAGTRTYSWDALGRLMKLEQGGQIVAAYDYNHRGERIRKIVDGKTTGFIYEDGLLSAELDGKGKVTRQYIHLADLPIAVLDTPEGVDAAADDGLVAVLRDLRHIAAFIFGPRESRITWLHTNHLGAPEAATDAQGLVVWEASYSPFGRASIQGQGFTLSLRLPGQYEDAESGLFYNLHRYYDPDRGRYLTPDPLGTPDGPDRYAYARSNPLRYVDPEGLVLFAFDGTGNTDDTDWLKAHNSSLSNAVRFREGYLDRVRYVTGVGTDHAGRDSYPDIIATDYTGYGGMVPDEGGNYSGPARIERMQQYLNAEAEALLDDAQVFQIDIVGFSRGAAQAREFANRLVSMTKNGVYAYDDPGDGKVHCQRVNFRFMGLFDTVLSSNRSNVTYRLVIPEEFAYVAQAVALSEYRSAPAADNVVNTLGPNGTFWDDTRVHLPDHGHWGSFPLESIGPSSFTAGRTRIERGFIGAHSDIGGGYPEGENGLASVALSWMVAQARIAGVPMKLGADAIDMRNPVIHDQSNAIRVGNPLLIPEFVAPGSVGVMTKYKVEDRQVRGGAGTGFQRGQDFGSAGGGSMTNAQTHQFINYFPRAPVSVRQPTDFIPSVKALGNKTGVVDMQNYLRWLQGMGYVFSGA